MRRIHAYLSILQQTVTPAQRAAIAARSIEWQAYPPRSVNAVWRRAVEVWGPRDQLQALVQWFGEQGFDPIVCAAFGEQPSGAWRRIRGVPIRRAAWNAVAPQRVNGAGELEHPQPTDPFTPPVWTLGWPMPEDVEEDVEE